MLVLAYAGILVGGLTLLTGISGHSYSEVVKGETSPFIPLLKGSNNPAVTGGPKLPEPLGNEKPPTEPPQNPTTFAKASGLALVFAQKKHELETFEKRKLTSKEESELRTYVLRKSKAKK